MKFFRWWSQFKKKRGKINGFFFFFKRTILETFYKKKKIRAFYIFQDSVIKIFLK